MAIDKATTQFRLDDRSEVLAIMQELATRDDGKGWLNLQPWVDPEDMPKLTMWRHFLSNRGFAVPTGTWVPGRLTGKDGPTSAEIGVQHGAGKRALQQLDAAGVRWPSDWRPTQDHTRHGLVFEAPTGSGVDETLDFMIRALATLSAAPTDDRWVAGTLIQA